MAGESVGESFNPEDEGGATEQAQEAFREQQARAKQQQAQQQKQEATARTREDRVAAFLKKLLQTARDQELMLLLARCLEKNVPAGLLVGVVALIEESAEEEFELLIGRPLLSAGELGKEHKRLQAMAALPPGTPTQSTAVQTGSLPSNETGVRVNEEFRANLLPPHIKAAISLWAEGLYAFARTQPVRILVTSRAPDGTVFLPLAQLGALVLKKYLAAAGKDFDLADLREFATLVLTSLFNRLDEEQTGTRKLGQG